MQISIITGVEMLNNKELKRGYVEVLKYPHHTKGDFLGQK